MCKAFSAVVKKNGDVLWEFAMDSHEEIIKKFGLRDNENRPEFMEFCRIEITPKNGSYLQPDEWIFRIDENATPEWWSDAFEIFAREAHAKWMKKLYSILVQKPIVNTFTIEPPKKITKKHLDLLRKWASVWASVGASVGASVWASVRASEGASVWDSVGASVWASVWDSVGASVRASVGASVGAYCGGFFVLPRFGWKYTDKIKTRGYPFASCVKLYELGLVPSFYGKKWRLHGNKDARILWEGTL